MLQPCEIPSNYRAEQCEAFNNVPYGGRLLKWYPYYDSTRLCSLICRGEQSLDDISNKPEKLPGRTQSSEEEYSTSIDSEETVIVQLAEKVKDGTRCRPESLDICIGATCIVSDTKFNKTITSFKIKDFLIFFILLFTKYVLKIVSWINNHVWRQNKKEIYFYITNIETIFK